MKHASDLQMSSFSSALLRAGFAIAMGLHGADKLVHFDGYQRTFPDYLGLGSPASLALVTVAQCPLMIFVLIGYYTRIAVLPSIATMLVAATVTHSHGWTANRELAVLYAFVGLAVFTRGDDSFSIGTVGRSGKD